jgi:hypothetical protein
MPYEAPLSPTPEDLDYYNNRMVDQFHSSAGDTIAATAKLALTSGPTAAISDMVGRKVLQDDSQPKLSVQELNKKYPNLEVPFNEPTQDSIAASIAQKQDYKQQLASVIAKGPSGAVYGISNFGASLVASAIDPVNLLGAMAGGAVLSAVARTGTLGAGMALRAGSQGAEAAALAAKNASLITRAAEGMAGAAAGVAIPEAISGVNAVQSQEDYGVGTYVKSVAANAAIFGIGGHVVLPESIKFLKRTLGGKPDAVAQASAIVQAATDRRVDTTPILKQVLNETDGHGAGESPSLNPMVPPKDYAPLDASKPVSAKLYAATETTRGEPVVLEHELGKGIQLTDDPVVANGHAARGFAETEGRVIEHELKDAKLLDLEKPLPADISPTLDEAQANLPARQVIDALPEQDRVNIEQTLKEQGYDGYRHEGGDYLGAGNKPHNVVTLFDAENPKLERTQEYQPSAEATRQPTQADAAQAGEKSHAFENDVLHDPIEQKAFEDAMKQPIENPELAKAQADTEEYLQEVEKQIEQGHFGPQSKNIMKSIRSIGGEEEDQAFKSYVTCVLGNG